MNNAAIIYPSIAMFTLTLGCIFRMGYLRYRSIRAREVKISYYRTYDKGSQTKRLHLIGRHVQNHFEVPPLFHSGIILTYATGATGATAVLLAWLFVAGRIVHTAIHLGSNNVTQRFLVFGFTLLMLGGLWLNLLIFLA